MVVVKQKIRIAEEKRSVWAIEKQSFNVLVSEYNSRVGDFHCCVSRTRNYFLSHFVLALNRYSKGIC
jgi:hypothetical protein